MKKGLLIVYTGKGKGKTTAALGLAMRSCGHKLPVCMAQFVKGSWKSGEIDAAKRFRGLFDIFTLGRGFFRDSKDFKRDREAALRAWDFAKKLMYDSKYRIVILDELTYLMKYGIIDEGEVVDVLNKRRDDLHIIVTGRDAPQSLIDAADLVTEMKNIKHPYHDGVKAQQGIEF